MRRQDNPQCGPRWRAVLEERWRDRLQQVTELSLAYHGAAGQTAGGVEDERARRLLRQAVAARRRLADTEDALGRLAAGGFGRCEQCGAAIPQPLLAAAPETRYCPGCAVPVGVTRIGATVTQPARPVPAQRAAAGSS
jgi:RNA polymerase-binding transcription factor DksA